MAEYICSKCYYEGKPRKRKRGSGKTEFFMWMIFPLGLPYTFWRMLTKTSECANCGSSMIADKKNAIGMMITRRLEQEISGKSVARAPFAPDATKPPPPPTPDPAKQFPRLTPDPDQW